MVYVWNSVGSTVTKTNNDRSVQSSTAAQADSQCYTELVIGDFSQKFEFTGTPNILGISTVNDYQADYFPGVSSGYGLGLESGYKFHNGGYSDIGLSFHEGDVATVIYSYLSGEFSIQINDSVPVLLYTLPPSTPVYIATAMRYTNCVMTNTTEGIVWRTFLDISEDIAMVSESFLDVSQDDLPTYQIFQDISTDDILITEIFQDLSADYQGRIEIFTDVSINQGDIAWGRFYDISEDIPDSYPSTIIKRINE